MPRRRPSLTVILKAVADNEGIDVADLLGTSRRRAVARPRQIAMWLARRLTDRSFPEIASAFGGRDHTTIVHGCRKIDTLREKHPGLAQEIDALEEELASRHAAETATVT